MLKDVSLDSKLGFGGISQIRQNSFKRHLNCQLENSDGKMENNYWSPLSGGIPYGFPEQLESSLLFNDNKRHSLKDAFIYRYPQLTELASSRQC